MTAISRTYPRIDCTRHGPFITVLVKQNMRLTLARQTLKVSWARRPWMIRIGYTGNVGNDEYELHHIFHDESNNLSTSELWL